MFISKLLVKFASAVRLGNPPKRKEFNAQDFEEFFSAVMNEGKMFEITKRAPSAGISYIEIGLLPSVSVGCYESEPTGSLYSDIREKLEGMGVDVVRRADMSGRYAQCFHAIRDTENIHKFFDLLITALDQGHVKEIELPISDDIKAELQTYRQQKASLGHRHSPEH